MNLAHIAIRLTEAAARIRQPLRRALRALAARKCTSGSSKFFPRVALYWRKRAARLSQPLVVNHQTNQIAINLSQRIHAHFGSLSAEFVSRSTVSMHYWVAKNELSFSNGRIDSPRLEATNLFGMNSVMAGNIKTLSPAGLPSASPSSSYRMNPTVGSSKTSAVGVPPLPMPGRPSSFLLWKRSYQALNTLWPQRALRGLGTRDESSTRLWGMGPRDRLEPARPPLLTLKTPLTRLVAGDMERPRLTVERFVEGDVTHARPPGAPSLKPFCRELANEQDVLSGKRMPPLSLVWRKPSPVEEAHDSELAMSSLSATSPEPLHVPAVNARPRSTISEGVVSQTRDALLQEMLSGSAVERLADDVMRRIDKRLRIERERRGL